jgi:Na+/melibiose symporter-like transporter
MASYRTPAVSLMPDVTVKPLRSKANAIINLMGTAGGIVSLIFMSFLANDYQSYIPTFALLSFLMVALLIVFLLKVKEPKLVEEMEEESKLYGLDEKVEEITETKADMPKEVRKSFYLILLSIVFWFMAYNAATTKFSDYSGVVLNMGYTIPLLIAQAAAVISYIPIGIIASKFGRKKTILVGIIILSPFEENNLSVELNSLII